MSQTFINALLFIVLLGTLVTVHEAGHFFAAKAFGIKVLRFSIGFGPKLLGFQWGETEYWISALPLGGYVKMAGENPEEELAASDQGRGFLEQAPWKRALVAFAGPAMNLIFPVIVFFFAYSMTTMEYVPLVASVYPDQPAYAAGLRPGDRIVAIEDKPIRCFSELQEIVGARPGMATKVDFQRGGASKSAVITPVAFESKSFFGTEVRGLMGIGLNARSSIISVESAESPAAKAGLLTFDRIAKVEGTPVKSYPELVEALSRALSSLAGSTVALSEEGQVRGVRVSVVRSGSLGGEAGALTVWETFETEIFPDFSLAPRPSAIAGIALGSDTRSPAEIALGIDSTEMVIFSVEPSSPAWTAGLRPSDRIATVQEKPVASYVGFSRARIDVGEGDVKVGYVRNGEFAEANVSQRKEIMEDTFGNKHEVLRFGAMGDFRNGSFSEIEKVPFKPTLSSAASKAFRVLPREIGRTAQSIWMVLFSSKVSARNVGGPIAIYHATAQTAEAGAEVFLRFMGFISINLGLMNLIPIPVLDGFHILSSAVEMIRRRPLGDNVRIVLSYLGLACLLALMILAFRNDMLNFILR